MARRYGSGSVRELSRGRWEVTVSAGNDPGTGQRRRVSRVVHGTKRDAEAVRASMLLEVRAGAHQATAIIFTELLDRWLDHGARDWSPTTLNGYQATVKNRIKPVLGRRPLKDLSTVELDGFYRGLEEKGLAPATVRQTHAIIRRCLAQGVKWGLLARNPAADASPPKVRRDAQDVPEVPDAAVVAKLITSAEEVDPDLAVLVRVAAAAGMRRGELVGLQWGDVDLEHAELLVSRNVVPAEKGIPITKAPKSWAARRVPIDAGTVEVLAGHRVAMAERADALGHELDDNTWLWWRSTPAVPWHPDGVSSAWRALCRRVGVSGVRLHDLRHFSVTTALDAGVPLPTVAARHGHRDGTVTLSVYAHRVEATDRAAADAVGRLLDKA